jgi:aspartyl-tRNA(Asn)/glutamyl-tRNA(Gln) amidotransferase subunit A
MALYPNEHETIEGVGRALRAGRTTCVEVLEKCFDRIEEWEPRIKAWVRVDRTGAIAQAQSLDEELAGRRCRGPLHGIPIGIKDIIDVKGVPTVAGFGPWRDRVAQRDATVVASLRGAGAVILGKTVTTQFAWIDPPSTRNPWDLDRTPGGSSSGSAAAVAVGMCLAAIGTQTGGSIIRPASFCGVCGLKPSFGWIDVGGIVPFAASLDHPGPFARSPRDLALLFDELHNRNLWRRSDRLDPPSPPEGEVSAETPEEVEARIAPLLPVRDAPPRLLRPRGFYDRLAEPVMGEAFETALAALVGAGAEVTEVPDDAFDFEAIVRHHRVLMAAQAAMEHEARLSDHRDDYATHIRALVEEGLSIPAIDYLRSEHDHWKRKADLLREPFHRERIDALVTPATIGPAPGPQTTGDPAFNSPWSYLGWPAVSFPIGLSPDGLPLAIQLVGRRGYVEHDLLTTASWCEDVIRRAFRASARSD